MRYVGLLTRVPSLRAQKIAEGSFPKQQERSSIQVQPVSP